MVFVKPHTVPRTWSLLGRLRFLLLYRRRKAVCNRPSLARTARLVDAHLALHDRLGTAWELRDEPASLIQLQRRDALKQLDKHTPRTALSLQPRRSHLILFGVALTILALFLLLPNRITT